MSATNRCNRVILLAVLTLATAPGRAADTGTPEQSPAFRIRIYDYAAIPASMLQRAAGRAERIFSPAGIELQWLHCRTSMDDLRPGDPACSAPVGPTDIIVRLLTEKMARKLARQSDCAGYAIHTKDGLGAKAGIYIHRVTELERQSNAPPARHPRHLPRPRNRPSHAARRPPLPRRCDARLLVP